MTRRYENHSSDYEDTRDKNKAKDGAPETKRKERGMHVANYLLLVGVGGYFEIFGRLTRTRIWDIFCVGRRRMDRSMVEYMVMEELIYRLNQRWSGDDESCF